jgi:hypothetical protein
VKVRARVAALSFGGPAAWIAVMHGILADEKKWNGEGFLPRPARSASGSGLMALPGFAEAVSRLPSS